MRLPQYCSAGNYKEVGYATRAHWRLSMVKTGDGFDFGFNSMAINETLGGTQGIILLRKAFGRM